MLSSNLRKPHPFLRLNTYHASIKPAQTSPTPASESFPYKYQTCTNLTHSCLWILLRQAWNLHKPHPLASESFSYKQQTCKKLTHSCVWILLMLASNLHKPHPLLRLNPSQASSKPAKNSLTLAFESFSCLHQTCTNLTHSCVWILLMLASNLHKPHPLLRLNPSHTSIKPAKISPTLAFESFSCLHQTCTNLTHSCVWILLRQAWNLHKPHPLASESFSYKQQTCKKLTHSCVWILLMLASNLHKPHPLLRLNPSQASSKPAKNSLTLAFESFSCLHQTCTNLTHSCVWILLMLASNLHKPHPLLRLNPSHTSIKPAKISPTLASESFSWKHQTCKNLTSSCVWILIIQAANLHKPHSLLRLNPSHKIIKPAENSLTLAFESFSYKHQTCTNLTPSCLWILLIKSSNLPKTPSLLRLNPSHASIKPAKNSLTLAFESFSCLDQTCTNLTHSCVWILFMQAFNLPNLNHSCIWFLLIQASNLHKPNPLLRLNPSHAFIKPAQTSPFLASQYLSCEHQTCTNLTHSCVWILPIQVSNLHKPHPLLSLNPSQTSMKPAQTSSSCVWMLLIEAANLQKTHSLLRLNPSHACIKHAQTSPTPASESLSSEQQTCKKLTHSCVWILLMLASTLHKPHPLLRLNPSHACIKPAQTSPTPASESFSYKHQTCKKLTHSCVWILLMLSSNLRKPHPFLRLNPYHTSIKPAQTSLVLASESFSYKHQTCTNLTPSCVWILLIKSSNLQNTPSLLRLNPSHASIKPA